MNRIDYTNNSKLDIYRDILNKGKDWMGYVTNDGRIMAHKPKILKAFYGLAESLYFEGKVDSCLKRMIAHIASSSSECNYLRAHTVYSSLNEGISLARLQELLEFETSEFFTDKEKAALNMARKASALPNKVTDEDFERLKKHFDSEAIVEIIGVISLFSFLSCWNSTFNTEIEDDVKNFYESLNSLKNDI